MAHLTGRNFLRFWFPALGYSGIIFFISSWPRLQAPLGEFNFDKICHVLEYLPLGFLLMRALSHQTQLSSNQRLLSLVIAGSFFYGLTDEFHQSFVAGRTAAGLDVMADTIGGALGAWFYLKFSHKQPPIPSPQGD